MRTRKGKEIAELLINRTLVEQGLRAKKLEVTAAEIDQEIETWPAAVRDQPRRMAAHPGQGAGISPMQYASDIIYPAIGFGKLCAGRVHVTPNDMKHAFEAQYAEKIRCRMILVDTQTKAVGIWEELREESWRLREARDGTIDGHGSRSLGGLLAEPITRHAYPQTISDAAFRNWSTAKRKTETRATSRRTAAITGPIQVNEIGLDHPAGESLIPAEAENRLQGRTGSQADLRDDLRGEAQGNDGRWSCKS